MNMGEAQMGNSARLTVSHWTAASDWPLLDLSLGEALRLAAKAVPDRLALVEAAVLPTVSLCSAPHAQGGGRRLRTEDGGHAGRPSRAPRPQARLARVDSDRQRWV